MVATELGTDTKRLVDAVVTLFAVCSACATEPITAALRRRVRVRGREGKPPPQTQGKIERWHQTLKNRILLQNYFLPGDLEAQIDAFVAHYNHQRYHESLKNLKPADVYTGRGQTILLEREKIKRRTMKLRRLQHAKTAAQLKPRCARPSLSQAAFCLKIPDDGHNRFIAVSTKEVLHLVRTLFLAVLTTLFVLRGTVPSGLEICWRRGP
jgi:hypothetical protein